MLNGLGLFAGIGGLELGLERAGLCNPACFVENNEYCQKVLAKRFPEVPIWDDVKTFDGKPWEGIIDVISGGFPCQDVSLAGKQVGIGGSRSGLWTHFWRIIREIRPLFAIIENVSGLYTNGIERVNGDLAEIEYNLEWVFLSAKDMGADHDRQRVFGIAYPQRHGINKPVEKRGISLSGKKQKRKWGEYWQHFKLYTESVAPTKWQHKGCGIDSRPLLIRSPNGISRKLDENRLKMCGNAVVPQCAEYIGRLIMEAIKEKP